MNTHKGFTVPYLLVLLFTVTFVGVGTYQIRLSDNIKPQSLSVEQDNDITGTQDLIENNGLGITAPGQQTNIGTTADILGSSPAKSIASNNNNTLTIQELLAAHALHYPDEKTNVEDNDVDQDKTTEIAEGGIGGTGKTVDIAEGGIGGTGKIPLNTLVGDTQANGVIKGFGSVYSNGVRFLTHDAKIMVNGQPATENDLHEGMRVIIDGEIDESGKTGIARTITFDYDLIGEVEVVNVELKIITIGGTRIIVDDELTVLDQIRLEQLVVGDKLGVSGQFNSQGDMEANYIAHRLGNSSSAAESDDLSVSLSGYVSRNSLNNRQKEYKIFKLGNKVVAYGKAELIGFEDDVLTENQYVFVEGRAHPEYSFIIIASRIENRYLMLNEKSSASVTMSGLVTQSYNPERKRFALNDQVVVIDSKTLFVRGDVENITVNTKLKIEAIRNANGELIANRIVFPLVSDIFLESFVISVDPISKTARLWSMNLPVTVDNNTLIFDSSVVNTHSFSLADIKPGDRVRVFGQYQGEAYTEEREGHWFDLPKNFYKLGTGEILATRFERIDNITESGITVQGPYTELNSSSFFRIYGLTIGFMPGVVEVFDPWGAYLSQSQFFNYVEKDMVVRIYIPRRLLINPSTAFPTKIQLME